MDTTAIPLERPQIVLRPIATPLPLGFVALGVGTWILTAYQLGWLPVSQIDGVALAVLAFTAPLQATASIVGFRARDAVAATGMGVLAGTWTIVGITLLTSAPGSTSDTLGVTLVGTAAALAVAAMSATEKPVAAAVLTVATIRFAVTGIAQITASTAWLHAAGWIGLLLAVLAWYAAAAFQLESVRHHAVLPLMRRQPSQQSNGSATVAAVSQQVIDEPGVRAQL